MAIAQNDTYTLDLTMWNGRATEVLRVSGGRGDGVGSKYTTTGGSTPASTDYLPRITNALMLARGMFPDRQTFGRSTPAAGEVQLRNEDFALDYLRTYSCDGRPAIMNRGQPANTFPSGWTQVLNGTADPFQWDQNGVRVMVRDAQKYASIQLQTNLFAGTNTGSTGLEGTASDLKGKGKPLAFGRLWNIPGTLVNPSLLIFQFHDGVALPTNVFDGGSPLNAGLNTWTSQASGFAGSNINGVAGSGVGTYIAVGAAGKLFRSVNAGITWTVKTSGFGANDILGIAWGMLGGVATWIAVGAAGTLSISTDDGLTWATQTSSFGASGINCVAIANGVAVIGGVGGKAATSANGTAWTARTSTFTAFGADVKCVAFGNNRWMFGGSFSLVATSLDNGATWTNQGSPDAAGNTWFALVYGPAGFVGMGASGKIYQSATGSQVTWTNRGGTGGPVTPFGTTTITGGFFFNGEYIACAGGTIASSVDGITWDQQFNVAATTFSAIGGGPIVITAGQASVLYTSAGVIVYALITDLQDPLQPPAPGAYGYFSGAAGSYIRLGEPNIGKITLNSVEGATAADRTFAQLFVRAGLQRAGLTAGAWSATDITACDTANSAECGFYSGPDDTYLCGDVADLCAQTGGAGWWGDNSGVIRLQILTASSTNLLGQGDDLNTAPWGAGGGTPVATNAFARYNGRSFSRLSNCHSGPWGYALTLTAGGTYRYSGFIKSDGVSGTFNILVRDNTTSQNWAGITFTIASNGTITCAQNFGWVGSGSLVAFLRMPGPDNVYAFCMEATGLTGGDGFFIYASSGNSGDVTSILLSGLTLNAGSPSITVDENDMVGAPFLPLDSGDANQGIPPYQIALRYAQNHAVLNSTDLAGDVVPTERTRLGTEWQTSTATNTAVLTAHPMSQPQSIDTLYAYQAGADTESARRLALMQQDHQWFQYGVEMTTAFQALEVATTVDIISQRYNVGIQRFRHMGIKPEAKSGNTTPITYTIWK